jgi:hypothetical protein
MALRVRAETGEARRSRQVLLTSVEELDETEQSEARSVTDERHADVPVKITADLARVRS